MNDVVVLDGDCKLLAQIDGDLSLLQTEDADAGIIYMKRDFRYPVYDGPTVFEPGAEPQILETRNTVLLENITINPIPQNYGRITWNGNTLTVS